jgi:hypothetical protein
VSRYAQLFEVNLEHGYYLNFGSTPFNALAFDTREFLTKVYSVEQIFTLFPTNETMKILAGYRMIVKNKGDGFLVAVELDPNTSGSQPLVSVDQNMNLRFAISLKDKTFTNYTSLPMREGGLFYFSNRSGNPVPGNYLTRSVSNYDTSRAYEAGELYLNTVAPNEGLFQALRDTGPAGAPIAADWTQIPPDTYDSSINYTAGSIVLADYVIYRALINNPGTDLNNAAEWESIDQLANQHVTADDYLPLHAEKIELDVSSAGQSQVSVLVYRLGEPAAVWQNLFISDNGNLDVVQLYLSDLKAGAYHLEVRDNTDTVLPDFDYDFYLDHTALEQGWFGVIEIGAGNGSFALLDGGGELRNPTYSINFLSRPTRWRYIFPDNQPIGSGAEVVQEDSEGRILVTGEPRPLTRFGGGLFLQTDLPSTPDVSEEVVLPKPKVNRIRHQDSQWFSEIHLSNLPI